MEGEREARALRLTRANETRDEPVVLSIALVVLWSRLDVIAETFHLRTTARVRVTENYASPHVCKCFTRGLYI